MSASELKITRKLPEKGKYGPTSLEINGVDIANVVTSYMLTHDAGGEVSCLLTLVTGVITAEVGAENVHLDASTLNALAALGYVHRNEAKAPLAAALDELCIQSEADGRVDFAEVRHAIVAAVGNVYEESE